jgi:uncharacterized protein
MSGIDRDEIVRLTEGYGGQWGIQHTRRLLHLIEVIGAGVEYDEEVVWLAAHLHDWGGYPSRAQPGLDHAERSRVVAESFLRERGYDQERMARVLEAIAFHHRGGAGRSIESILLSDADALDFLGVVGVLRDFSRNPQDMRKGYQGARSHRERLPQSLVLDASKALAACRIRQMDELLAAFEEDTFGCF